MSTEGQLMTILGAALLALFGVMIVLELIEHDTPIETAAGGRTLERLRSLVPVLQRIDADNLDDVVGLASSCHAGYSVTDSPYTTTASNADTSRLESSLVRELSLEPQRLKAGHARLTREQLLDLTKGREAQLFDRSIDNQISRLRRKVEADPKNPRIILTQWGGGYVFAAEVEWEP